MCQGGRQPSNGVAIFVFDSLRCLLSNLKPTRRVRQYPRDLNSSESIRALAGQPLVMIALFPTMAFVSGTNENYVALVCIEAPQPPQSEPTQLYVSTRFLQIYSSACIETPAAAIRITATTLHIVLSSTRAHRDRLLYAVTGLLFNPTSPKPFGGTRTQPGYSEYRGKTTDSLLHFIVEGCLRFCPQGAKGETWVSVLLLIKLVKKALKLQMEGEKDGLDELVLKGMKKSGHIPWNTVGVIPGGLRHQDERDFDRRNYVEFTPRRLGQARGLNQKKYNTDA